MIRSCERLVRPFAGLLAVALVCLLPSLARAENVVFRNDCRSSVVVQTGVVVKGVLQKDQPNLLRPGDSTDKIPTDVDRVVIVYDARSNRVLFRDVLKADPKNPRAYSIMPDPQVMNKVRLVQRKVK
jgi:hypothetical protein